MARAIGTPMISAIADVISVPSTSAHAPNEQPALALVVHAACCWSWDTSQFSRAKKFKKPTWLNAVADWPIRRTKKYPIRISTPTASALSPNCSSRSGRRCSGDRSRIERPP